jgi:hypothetical protein
VKLKAQMNKKYKVLSSIISLKNHAMFLTFLLKTPHPSFSMMSLSSSVSVLPSLMTGCPLEVFDNGSATQQTLLLISSGKGSNSKTAILSPYICDSSLLTLK